tara:strand:+ start:27666 stop:28478 length:813 start_codon:yes stop_codon:yes gene_type:complete
MNKVDRIQYYNELKEEKALRENIRQIIKFVKQKRTKETKNNLGEESQLRNLIQQIVSAERSRIVEAATPDNDPSPNKTTGINVLEDLLKKIIPILEDDYKLLTTDEDQRQSFRAHIINGVIQSLAPAQANDSAETEIADVREALDVDIANDEDETPAEFIDITGDDNVPEKEVRPEEEFGTGLEGQDETGRNMAYQTFKKIEKGVLDSYELLSNPADKELFYDYLLANLKLYFDRFEEELSVDVSEPGSPEYDQAKGVTEPQEEEPTLEI